MYEVYRTRDVETDKMIFVVRNSWGSVVCTAKFNYEEDAKNFVAALEFGAKLLLEKLSDESTPIKEGT